MNAAGLYDRPRRRAISRLAVPALRPMAKQPHQRRASVIVGARHAVPAKPRPSSRCRLSVPRRPQPNRDRQGAVGRPSADAASRRFAFLPRFSLLASRFSNNKFRKTNPIDSLFATRTSENKPKQSQFFGFRGPQPTPGLIRWRPAALPFRVQMAQEQR